MGDKTIVLPLSFNRFYGNNLLIEDETYVRYVNEFGVETYRCKKYVEDLMRLRNRLTNAQCKGFVDFGYGTRNIVAVFLNYKKHNMRNIVNISGLGEGSKLWLLSFVSGNEGMTTVTPSNITKNAAMFDNKEDIVVIKSSVGDGEYTDDFLSLINNLNSKFIILTDNRLQNNFIEEFGIEVF